MLAKCWSHACQMLVTCWSHAGHMHREMLFHMMKTAKMSSLSLENDMSSWLPLLQVISAALEQPDGLPVHYICQQVGQSAWNKYVSLQKNRRGVVDKVHMCVLFRRWWVVVYMDTWLHGYGQRRVWLTWYVHTRTWI